MVASRARPQWLLSFITAASPFALPACSQAPVRMAVMDVPGLRWVPSLPTGPSLCPPEPSSSQALASLSGDPTSRVTPGAWAWPQRTLSAVAQGLRPPHLLFLGPGSTPPTHRAADGEGGLASVPSGLGSFSGHAPACELLL